MATTETAQQTHDRPGRRRPFTTWMKKLANLKSSSSADGNQTSGTKRNAYHMRSQSKKQGTPKKNNPYPESGHLNGSETAPANDHLSFSTAPTRRTASMSSMARSRQSDLASLDGLPPPTRGTAVMATEQDIAHSDAARSHGASSGEGTIATAGGAGRGNDSTFSSPAPSVRSLTTTLTTIHSAAAAPAPNGNTLPSVHNSGHGSASQRGDAHSIHFSHQFPTSPPPSALPPHLVPQGSGGHPSTYSTATANSLLTDNASILTLASSSKRRRRRSMDTDASVRAMAPSSLFGGSRESLPLSVLSSNIESGNTTTAPGLHQNRPGVAGPAERASIYSATGVAPALPSERNSYYAQKQNIAGDGGSIKSGLLGHSRNDSISGSIGGTMVPGSPLAGPRDTTGRLSRTNSAWGEAGEEAEKTEKEKSDVEKMGQ